MSSRVNSTNPSIGTGAISNKSNPIPNNFGDGIDAVTNDKTGKEKDKEMSKGKLDRALK